VRPFVGHETADELSTFTADSGYTANPLLVVTASATAGSGTLNFSFQIWHDTTILMVHPFACEAGQSIAVSLKMVVGPKTDSASLFALMTVLDSFTFATPTS